MVWAFLEVVDYCKAIEQASINGSFWVKCSISRRTGIEVVPRLLCRTYEQRKGRVRSTTP